MHIVLTCPYSIDLPGGVQSQVIGMAKSLSTEHRLTILAPGDMVPKSLRGSSVETILFGRSLRFRANGSVAPISLLPTSATRLHRYLTVAAPDVLIIHEPMVPLVSIAALFGSAKMKIGVFHRAGPTKALALLRPLASVILPKLDAGVVVSEEARESVRALVGDRSEGYWRIPNAVDTTRFEPNTQTVRRKRSLVFLGRHEQRKGLSVLLDAFSKLSPEFSLFIIGTGPETEELKRKYSSNDAMHWCGRLADNEVADLMHESEIFVAPSLGGESFGVILLEAMAAEIPVLCSDIPGYRLAAEDAAVFVEPGDATKLASAVKALSEDDSRRRGLVQRGRQRSREYDFSVARERYLDVIHTKVS